MREYLFQTLQILKLLTGLNQYEKILDGENPEDQICLLLDELERTCKKFGYISDEKKKQIISKEILHDETMTALTPRKVYGWLAKYWTALTPAEVSELTVKKEDKKEWKPLDPEEAQKYIDKWKKAHSSVEEPMTKQSKVKVMLSEGRSQHKLKQEVVDCHKCGNDAEKRVMCVYCMGHGKVKRTIL